ncbi:MAG: hypothetical protein NTZ64_06700 [Polaromonas sp.]|nr:hypothetical protein [Polaromonas sp.]
MSSVTSRLYKAAMLRIKADYNVVTRELRNARLVEFVEYVPRVDEDELVGCGIEKGAAAPFLFLRLIYSAPFPAAPQTK